jgi:hypothetical protein
MFYHFSRISYNFSSLAEKGKRKRMNSTRLNSARTGPRPGETHPHWPNCIEYPGYSNNW